VTGSSLVQGSPTKCRNKMTKPPVRGGQGPYKDCRAFDDNDDDDELEFITRTEGNVLRF
jgi:hypothetical protein